MRCRKKEPGFGALSENLLAACVFHVAHSSSQAGETSGVLMRHFVMVARLASDSVIRTEFGSLLECLLQLQLPHREDREGDSLMMSLEQREQNRSRSFFF